MPVKGVRTIELFRLFGTVALNDEASQGLDTVDNKAQGTNRTLGGTLKTVGKFGAVFAAAAGAAGAAIFGLANKTANYADSVLDASDATGLATDSIQEWEAVARQAGVGTDTMVNAAGRLNRQWSSIKRGSGDASNAIGELGLNMEKLDNMTADERMDKLVKSLAEVEDPAERARMGSDLFGRQWEEVAPIVGMGADEIDNIRESYDGVMTEEDLEKADKFRQNMETVKEQFAIAGREIAMAFMPILNQFMEWIMEHMPAIQETMNRVFEVLEIAVSTGIEAISDFISWLQTLFEENEEQTDGIIEQVMGFKESFIRLIEGLIQFLTMLWDEWGEDIIDLFTRVFDTVGKTISGALDLITDVFNVFASLFKGDWEQLWEDVQTLVKNLIGNVVDIIESAIDSILWFFGTDLKTVINTVSDIFGTVKDYILGTWEDITGGIKGFINVIIGAINSMIRGINSIDVSVPDWVPGFGGSGFSPSLDTIPKLAEGGTITRRGSALVGEEGPELLDLPQGAQVTPLDKGQSKGDRVVFERGAFEGVMIMDDYGVDRLMDRVMERMRDQTGMRL